MIMPKNHLTAQLELSKTWQVIKWNILHLLKITFSYRDSKKISGCLGFQESGEKDEQVECGGFLGHRSESTECTTQSVGSNVNYRRKLITAYQY